jgi:hypothetical protein
MTRTRTADRWLEGMIVALVVVGFIATAPRAERDAASHAVNVVEAPATPCNAVAAASRAACLNAARATLLRR